MESFPQRAFIEKFNDDKLSPESTIVLEEMKSRGIPTIV
jgi:hypothetical protein